MVPGFSFPSSANLLLFFPFSVIRQGFWGKIYISLSKALPPSSSIRRTASSCPTANSTSSGLLGDIELVLGIREFQMAVIAETDLLCLAFPHQKAEVLFHTSTQFSNRIAYDLAKRNFRATAQRAAALGTGQQRLCAYLLQKGTDDVFREPLTKTAVALEISYRHLLADAGTASRRGAAEKNSKWIPPS